jgi:hypothetical protein
MALADQTSLAGRAARLDDKGVRAGQKSTAGDFGDDSLDLVNSHRATHHQ